MIHVSEFLGLPSEFDGILEAVLFCVLLLFNLVQFFRTKNLKYLKEILDMKYRKVADITAETVQAADFSSARFKPVYRLNKSTGELEETDEVVDISELIDSSRDAALKACLERFFPEEEDADSVLEEEYSSAMDSLDEFNALQEVICQYRDELDMQFASDAEVMAAVKKRADEIQSRLSKKE